MLISSKLLWAFFGVICTEVAPGDVSRPLVIKKHLLYLLIAYIWYRNSYPTVKNIEGWQRNRLVLVAAAGAEVDGL